MLSVLLFLTAASASSVILQVSELYAGSITDCVIVYDLNFCFGDSADVADAQQGGEIIAVTPDYVFGIADCQEDPPWHLSAITNDIDYPRLVTAPASIVYIFDTWIDTNHPGFQGRARRGPAFDNGAGHYHGTHVAGIVASSKYGVNSAAQIVGVQVLDASGRGVWSNLIKALAWVATQPRGILNLSIGGAKSMALNSAIEALTRRGWPVVIAAGNERTDACLTSPASARGALVVGAFDAQPRYASFSNYGACVNIMAPGVDIQSLFPNNRYATLSGTSMAAPVVAGIWSLYPHLNATALKKFGKYGSVAAVPPKTSTCRAFLPNDFYCLQTSLLKFQLFT